MKTVLQVEFSTGLLEDRVAILRRSGCRVIAVLGCEQAECIDLAADAVGVVVIGHGAARAEREKLVRLFRRNDPNITIVCLLRRADDVFPEAHFNLPADDPTLWEQTVIRACDCYH